MSPRSIVVSSGPHLALAVTAVLFAGCRGGGAPIAPGEAPEGATRVAYAIIDVDPSAPPEAMLRIRAVDDGGAPKARGSVLGDVALSGPGTWNPLSERLSAMVRITNRSTHELDEPRMVLDWLSRPGVSAELVHEGDGTVGSAWAFADVARAGGVNRGSARQRIRFHAPGGQAFSFRVGVIADPAPKKAVDPDDDDDGYNAERDQDAGDDCDESDPTVYPGRGGCECLDSCDLCGAGECCAQACTGSCGCPEGCACDYESTWSGGDPDVTCVGASCDLTCQSYDHPCTISDCEGSDCDITCRSGASSCTVESCTGSECAAHCSSTSGGCDVDVCADGSSCEVECNDASGTCGVGTCEGSSCDLTCTRFGGPCRIETCEDALCTVRCEGTGGGCGVDRCEAGSTCEVRCETSSACAMTCAEGASCTMACTNTGSCALTCEGGAPIACGGGVSVCPGTPCP